MSVLGKYADLNALGVRDLESVIKQYPWFVPARRILLLKLAEMGQEYLDRKLKDTVAYLPCRRELFFRVREAMENENVFDLEELAAEFSEEIDLEGMREEPEKSVSKVVVAGGDYFSREDFEALERQEKEPLLRGGALSLPGSGSEEEGTGAEAPDGGKNSSPERAAPGFGLPAMRPEDFEAPEFYTETLARIYTEQGYYQEAIDVYAKLILLYPEKSTYFALLVNEIKSKNC